MLHNDAQGGKMIVHYLIAAASLGFPILIGIISILLLYRLTRESIKT
jgi:hypothetical protein